LITRHTHMFKHPETLSKWQKSGNPARWNKGTI
jgi:hypothetical protein